MLGELVLLHFIGFELMKVSIIVAIYKVEAYLRTCVQSILSQTYQDFELILVDDGSPDACPILCDEYARQDTRVRVIHKSNGGLSDARNVGIRAAKGEYIMFVDGDDFWKSKEGLALLMEEVSRTPQCDFIGFNCSYYYPSTQRYKPWIAYSEFLASPLVATDEKLYLLVSSGTFPMSACLKIIRHDFLIRNQLFFSYGVYSEDIPWFIELILRAHDFRFVNNYMYAYRKENLSSISSSFSPRKYNDLFQHLVNGLKRVEFPDVSFAQRQSLLSFWAYEYCILSAKSLCFPKYERHVRQSQLKQFGWLLSYRLNPKVRKICMVRAVLGLRLTRKLMYSYVTRKFLK